MYRLAIALLLVIAASLRASAQGLPVPSYWVSDRGSQLKFYAIDDHGNFQGVFNSSAAPPGCQYQTFEAHGGFFYPQIAIAVEWKNWTQDCHARTIWNGILAGGRTLQLQWGLLKHKANSGDLVPTKRGGIEIFHQQP